MTRQFLVAISLVVISPLSSPAQSFYSQTKDATFIYYTPAHSYLLPHAQRCFQNALRFHRSLFDYAPDERTTVIFQDFNDFGTGGASPAPWNFLNIGIEPYDYVYETGPANERMNWVMNHELAHIVLTDKAAGLDEFFRSIFFGKVSATADNPLSMIYSYLTTPRWFSPRWYHEGLAVFLETWMAGGIGRALGGYDEMTFRAMVNDSAYIYDYVGLESEGKTIDFQVGANSYLYGTRFVCYLALRYGPEKLLQWITRTGESRRYFAAQFENTYGTPLDDEWDAWIAWERGWQTANLDSIRQYPLTPFRKVTDQPLGSVSRSYFDSTNGKFYTAMNLPGQFPAIVSVDRATGSVERLCDVTTPAMYYVTSIAYDPSTSTIFYTTHNSRDWRGINSLDIATGKTKELLKDARIGDLVFNQADKSLWGVQHHDGYSNIVRMPPPYNSWTRVLELQYAKDVFDIDISPDGKFLTGSLIVISGEQTLIKFDIDRLMKGDASHEVLVKFDNNTSPYNFVFSPDGKYLFGSAYYTGVSNILRYELSTRTQEWISNCETGYFRPLPVSADSVFTYRYTGKGFLPIMIGNNPTHDISSIRYLGQQIIEKYPLLEKWTVPSPMTIDLDSFAVSSGFYNGLGHLRLSSAYPVVEGYKNIVGYGMRFDIGDPGFDHAFDLTTSYSPYQSLPTDERFHAVLNYATYHWKAGATYNGADFYDLFGPTKTSRKGYSLSLVYNTFFIYDLPEKMEFKAGISGYAGLEQLPDYQNIATNYDNFVTFNAKLDDVYPRRSLGAVDVEGGTHWNVNWGSTYVRGKVFHRIYGNFDIGFLLPIDHSSVWFRTSGGYAGQDFDEPFDNFYFGGFGNNWIDHQDEKRYREYYSFPGIELNAAGGSHYAKGMIEWALPPIRFRRFGFSDLFCNWSRVALFSTALATNFTSAERQSTLVNAGVQVDFRIIIFNSLESTLSFGYAAAVEQSQRVGQEFMASLKILR